MNWELKLFGGVILATVSFIAGIVFLINWGQEVSCRQTAELLGVEYHYSLNTDCFLRIDDHWERSRGQFSVRIKRG